MKILNSVVAVLISYIVFGLFRGAFYFLITLFFKHFIMWVAIAFLGVAGFWLIFKMVETAIITIPLMRFRIKTAIPSFIIGTWIIITSARKLFLYDEINYTDITLNVFIIIQIVEIVSTILILVKVNKFVALNKDFSSLSKQLYNS